MTLSIKGRFLQRGRNAAMVTFLMISTGIYSCIAHAQTLQDARRQETTPAVSPTGTQKPEIKLDHRVNVNAHAKPLDLSINSAYAELKPAVAPGGKKLFFSRCDSPDNCSGSTDKEDIWYAERDSAGDLWSKPVRIEGWLNNSGPNFVHNVSLSGDTIILGNEYLKHGKMKDGLSYSVNVNGHWTFPEPINITNNYNMSAHSGAFVNLHEGIIILAVERAESVGERDLFISFWDGKSATEPVNMGTIINSIGDESSPYLAADMSTLYFASKGHPGYGGYDIFVTHRLDDTWMNWSEPENLGPAVNTHNNEEFFKISHCGKKAVFSRQVSVHNYDLFIVLTKDLFGHPAEDPAVEVVKSFR